MIYLTVYTTSSFLFRIISQHSVLIYGCSGIFIVLPLWVKTLCAKIAPVQQIWISISWMREADV